jgi:hypothetical protein
MNYVGRSKVNELPEFDEEIITKVKNYLEITDKNLTEDDYYYYYCDDYETTKVLVIEVEIEDKKEFAKFVISNNEFYMILNNQKFEIE